jgi:hypothetical protein
VLCKTGRGCTLAMRFGYKFAGFVVGLNPRLKYRIKAKWSTWKFVLASSVFCGFIIIICLCLLMIWDLLLGTLAYNF